MANFIDALEKVDRIAAGFRDNWDFKKTLVPFRSALSEMSESALESVASGGEPKHVLVAMEPIAVLKLVNIYNKLLERAQKLNPASEIILSLTALDENSSETKLAWMEGKLPGQILTDVNRIASELGIEITNKACFIATAALGDQGHPDIAVLRQFRDQSLTTPVGKRIVSTYYRVSPPLARFISQSSCLRWATKKIIVRPLVFLARIVSGD
jgi:hypothetical protein